MALPARSLSLTLIMVRYSYLVRVNNYVWGLYYQDTEDTEDTVLIIMDGDGMVRGKLRMRLLPLDQTLMLTLMAGVSYLFIS